MGKEIGSYSGNTGAFNQDTSLCLVAGLGEGVVSPTATAAVLTGRKSRVFAIRFSASGSVDMDILHSRAVLLIILKKLMSRLDGNRPPRSADQASVRLIYANYRTAQFMQLMANVQHISIVTTNGALPSGGTTHCRRRQGFISFFQHPEDRFVGVCCQHG